MLITLCEVCGDIPCFCGHMYENWSDEALERHIKMLSEMLEKRHPKGDKDVDVGSGLLASILHSIFSRRGIE